MITGYDLHRLETLRQRATGAAEALRAVRTSDPAAASAMATVASVLANLEDHIGLIDRVTNADPMGSWHARTGAIPVAGWRKPPDDHLDDVVEKVDGVFDVAEAALACHDGGDDCAEAVAELTFELVAGTVLTPAGVEVAKVLVWCILLAVSGAMAQSPSIDADFTNSGGTPGEFPHEVDGTPVPDRSAPNGADPKGNLDYGGPDCRGLEFYGQEHPACG